jgi:hypothetical protein
MRTERPDAKLAQAQFAILIIAAGFIRRDEACQTVEDWIGCRFVDAAYDHNLECWWLLDEGRAYRVAVEQVPEITCDVPDT